MWVVLNFLPSIQQPSHKEFSSLALFVVGLGFCLFSYFCYCRIFFFCFIICSSAKQKNVISVGVSSRLLRVHKITRRIVMDFNIMDLRGAELYWKCLCKLALNIYGD